jgi:hypothetical protein
VGLGGELLDHVAVEAALPTPEHRRFRPLSARRARTKAPYKTDFHREALMALNRPKAARTVDLVELDDVRVRAVRAQQLALLFQPLVSVNL